jgi:hypothetical protein
MNESLDATVSSSVVDELRSVRRMIVKGASS